MQSTVVTNARQGEDSAVGVLFGGLFVLALVVGILIAVIQSSDAEARRKRAAEDAAKQQRWAHLVSRYGSEAAAGILAGQVWQGMTADMVAEALGRPVDVDERVMKTKRCHTWKYRPLGGNRYGLRVYFEDAVVVGWDNK